MLLTYLDRMKPGHAVLGATNLDAVAARLYDRRTFLSGRQMLMLGPCSSISAFQLFSFQLLPKRGPKAMSGPQWRIWRCGWGDRPAERLSAGNPLPGTHLRFGLRFLIALRLRVGAGSGLPGRALFGLRIGLSHLVKHCKGFWRQYLIFVIPIVTHHPSPHVVRIDDRGWNTSNCKQYLIAGRAKNCDPHQSMIA